jgi:DUF2934 family protein
MKNNLQQTSTIGKSEIGLLAYQLWEQAGRPSGQDLDFWLRAESQLRAAVKATPASTMALPASKEATKPVMTASPQPHAQRPLRLPGSSISRRNHRGSFTTSAMS